MTVSDEYGRFMRWLAAADATPGVRRMAKVVHNNLAAVERTSSAAGQRTQMLAPLLRDQLPQVDDRIELPAEAAAAAPLPWNRLRSLTIGPFRGFRREETFNLQKSVILFYGPNGSGKTSLCEGIEFALLGRVEEAEAKRMDALGDYLDNFHEGTHVAPRLVAEGGRDGVDVVPDEEIFRFSIIEKNRIESFARLAARTPAQANTLIATLFGLDAFNRFVNNFSANIDRALRLTRPQKETLDGRRAALADARTRVANDAQVLRSFDQQREQIAAEFQADCSYARLLELLGNPEQPGRYQELVRLLEEQLPPQAGISYSDTVRLRRSFKAKLQNLTTCRTKLQERIAQVSYRGLYRAVQALEANAPAGICPACETPLNQVTTNPYQRANEGLELLRDVADLEERQEQLERECSQISGQLKALFAQAERFGALEDDHLTRLRTWVRADDETAAWAQGIITRQVWQKWLRVVRKLKARDTEIQQRLDRQQDLVGERQRLETAHNALTTLGGRQDQHTNQINEFRSSIENFDQVNAELIKAADREDREWSRDLVIQNDYGQFYAIIRRYRDGLPEGLLADLNETTRELYNSFNADDHADDLLTNLSLPIRGGDRIGIVFAGSPGQMRDALNVLSEGHLRCLGLAILLAKNIKLNLPILVFDDAVNAIDHDHRAGIRATIFGDPRLSAKQMLITCHSNEFIKDIQNQLTAQHSKLYVLDHHAGDHQPRVQGGSDRNYLVRARERLADGDQRQCLASCRQALENLTYRLWKSLVNRSEQLGAMGLVLRSPNGRPELRNLTDNLQKRISSGVAQGLLTGDAWTRRHEGLQEILNIPEHHLAWQYFNKGTHDEPDREDFEVQIVRNIVTALGKISDTLDA